MRSPSCQNPSICPSRLKLSLTWTGHPVCATLPVWTPDWSSQFWAWHFLDDCFNYHPGSLEADLKLGWVHFIILRSPVLLFLVRSHYQVFACLHELEPRIATDSTKGSERSEHFRQTNDKHFSLLFLSLLCILCFLWFNLFRGSHRDINWRIGWVSSVIRLCFAPVRMAWHEISSGPQ